MVNLNKQKYILENSIVSFNKKCSDDSECLFLEHIVDDGDKFMLYKGSKKPVNLIIGYIGFSEMISVIRALDLYKVI